MSTAPLELFLNRLKECRSLVVAEAECQLGIKSIPGFVEIETNRFWYGGYDILLGLVLHLSRQAEVLRLVEGLALHTAPVLVADIRFNEAECAIVSRVGPIESAPLIPFAEWKSGLHLTSIAQIHADVEALAARGVTNPAFRRGLAAWCVEPTSGRVLIPDWSQLERLDRNDLAEIHDEIDATAALCGGVSRLKG